MMQRGLLLLPFLLMVACVGPTSSVSETAPRAILDTASSYIEWYRGGASSGGVYGFFEKGELLLDSATQSSVVGGEIELDLTRFDPMAALPAESKVLEGMLEAVLGALGDGKARLSECRLIEPNEEVNGGKCIMKTRFVTSVFDTELSIPVHLLREDGQMTIVSDTLALAGPLSQLLGDTLAVRLTMTFCE